jgi:catechol 2,3-dioxygenase
MPTEGRTKGVSSRAIFGRRRRPERAAPGTHGEPPEGFRLPASTRPGPVRLQVRDLERSTRFYEDVLGMERLESGASRAALGARDDAPRSPLVMLEPLAGAKPAPAVGRSGLFHFAILLPDRAALGRFLAHAHALGLRLGASDHLVSESLYLADPDGLGIEVYADRPRSTWRRVGGELMMATDPLDLADLVAAGGGAGWTGMPPGTVIGHLHLRVGDLSEANRFYSAGLGLDRQVWSYPGALFFAAGGYHHHLGTNTWAGADVIPPAEDEARLLEWCLELPDAESLAATARSLERAGFAARRAGAAAEVTTRDPWGTALRLVAATPRAD